MIQAFYKSEPKRDTPYRQLSLMADADGWRVQLTGGTKWGPERAEVLNWVPVGDFDEGKVEYDRFFSELIGQGWRPYHPAQQW